MNDPSTHRGTTHEWPARPCEVCGHEFSPRAAPTVARYCSPRCRSAAASTRRGDGSQRATLARALARAGRALYAASAVDEREFLWASTGLAYEAREAFADAVEAGLVLFSAALDAAGRERMTNWTALRAEDALARERMTNWTALRAEDAAARGDL
jgi:hypothetical protein